MTMSEPSHIILNLNEMMEAYIEVEEEIVQETQSGEMQAEARAEDIRELGLIEGGRIKKKEEGS